MNGMVWKLYYDGGCNLCHSSKLKVEKWAARAGQPLEVDILQSDEAVAKGYVGDAMVLETDRVYSGGDAWLKFMEIAPWYLRWLSWAKYTPFTRWLVRLGYGLVARVRYRIWGTRSCPIPTAQQREEAARIRAAKSEAAAHKG